MKKKKCLLVACSKEFYTDSKVIFYCSEKCRLEKATLRWKKRNKKLKEERGIKKNCRHCQKIFRGTLLKQYCSIDCRYRFSLEAGVFNAHSFVYRQTEKGKEANRKSSRDWWRKRHGVKPENYQV